MPLFLTLALTSHPIIFGPAGQFRDIAVVGQLYYFLHYIYAQISNIEASDMRLNGLSYTHSILPTMIISLSPRITCHTPQLELDTADVSIWVALIQLLLKRIIMPNTAEHDRKYDLTRD
jgi:hypothetical protein